MESKKSPTRKDIQDSTAAPADPSRRSLLRGTVTAMPALLTLQSGAALARSSNLISATTSNAKDGRGRTLCLDTDSVTRVPGTDGLYDADDPAYGRVFAINDRQYRLEPRNRARRVSEEEMCNNGGVYYYKDRRRQGKRWQSVEVKKGVLVSATALSSFADAIHIYDL